MSFKCLYQVDLAGDSCRFSGAKRVQITDNAVNFYIKDNKDTQVLRCDLPHCVTGDGVGVRIYLGGWHRIDYVAIGYTHKSVYRHIKAKNIRQNSWVDLQFTHQDIVWKLANGFDEMNSTDISDIKIFIKGEPRGAVVSLSQLQVLAATDIVEPIQKSISPAVIDILSTHFRKALRDYSFTASKYMETGQCPMPGKHLLVWSFDAAKPHELDSVNSFCSSWHGMHLVISLLLYAEDCKTVAPIIAARVWVEQWLDNSYFRPDRDQKYTWYDHGTAERLLAMLLMWQKTAELGFDQRFANRLWHAIMTHVELLHSEAFYAYHQPIRYHNHAWFQDAALIAAALAFPSHLSASQWLANGISRFEDQLKQLIVRDGGFAIFIENSIGYHHGVQRLAETVGALAAISACETDIPVVAQELVAWSDFLRYPDGRAPAQGDTFRLPPKVGASIHSGKPWREPSCTVLPKAGYAVVKGNHGGKPWLLCLFNTSLSKTHKHEDNLSITFWFDGVEWLIDPSFYSHEYQQPISAYLRSARAHNNIYLNEVDYSKELWPAQLEGGANNGEFFISGSHQAYEGVEVSRSISGYLDRLEVAVVDELIGKRSVAPHDTRLAFHFAEDVQVSVMSDGYKLSHPDRDIALFLRFGANQKQGRILQDNNSAGYLFSAAGQGFQQQAATTGLEFTVQGNTAFTWSLDVAEFVKLSMVDSE